VLSTLDPPAESRREPVNAARDTLLPPEFSHPSRSSEGLTATLLTKARGAARAPKHTYLTTPVFLAESEPGSHTHCFLRSASHPG